MTTEPLVSRINLTEVTKVLEESEEFATLTTLIKSKEELTTNSFLLLSFSSWIDWWVPQDLRSEEAGSDLLLRKLIARAG